MQHYDDHKFCVNKISFHPSGKYLFSVSDDATINIFDIRMGSICFTLYGHDGPITSVNISSWGEYFATGGEDKIINFWKFNQISNNEHYFIEDQNFDFISALNTNWRNNKNKDNETEIIDSSSNLNYYPETKLSSSTLDKNKWIPFDPLKWDKKTNSWHSFKNGHQEQVEGEFYPQPSKQEHIPDSALSNTNFENVPNEISSVMCQIVSQLETLSNILQLLDQRIAINENLAMEAREFFTNLNKSTESKSLYHPSQE